VRIAAGPQPAAIDQQPVICKDRRERNALGAVRGGKSSPIVVICTGPKRADPGGKALLDRRADWCGSLQIGVNKRYSFSFKRSRLVKNINSKSLIQIAFILNHLVKVIFESGYSPLAIKLSWGASHLPG
jgi:hypothetical protein